ncbi:hypothetical protein C0995_014997 [Termitomyces sp. Mi166|nr:hypothetical protein C0995_014997 [Termitomyces sp. Mi166\
MLNGPEAQDSLFKDDSNPQYKLENVPQPLVRATLRLQFPPTYVVVGSNNKDFTISSPRITGLSESTIFGYKPPFSLPTYAAILLLGSQITYILRFFLARNIHIARIRAWDQTVASRGKGPDFWQPYVEEWDTPPVITSESFWETLVKRWLGGWFGLFVVRREFGFVTALLEGMPIVGLIFTISNRVGAAMWAHDLEKRQHFVATKKLSRSAHKTSLISD